MTEYLIELYVARTGGPLVTERCQSARSAAEELTRRGTAVRFRRSIFVPDEETCFVMFEAESPEAVRHAARLAAMPCDRVSSAITQT
jgi:hypothetical protein